MRPGLATPHVVDATAQLLSSKARGTDVIRSQFKRGYRPYVEDANDSDDRQRRIERLSTMNSTSCCRHAPTIDHHLTRFNVDCRLVTRRVIRLHFHTDNFAFWTK